MAVHVSFALLVHHELAHVALGHLDCLDSGVAPAAAIEDEIAAAIDEGAQLAASSPSGTDGQSDHRQCLELDADIHGLKWTVEYLQSYARERAAEMPSADMLIWSRFCLDPKSRRYLLILAATLLCSAFGAIPYAETALKKGTHLPAVARMMLFLYVEDSKHFQPSEGDNLVTPSTRVQPLIHAITISAQLEFAKAAFRRVEFNEPDPFEGLSAEECFNKVYTDLGITSAIDHWTATGERFESLRMRRREIDARLAKARLLLDPTLLLDWYGESS
jgi:hypothetical protein